MMRLADLFDGRFDDYFAAAHEGRPLWMFVHVPKTGGSSINGELMPVYGPSKHIFIDYNDGSRSYHELIDEAVDRFLVEAETKRFAFCTGHLLSPQVEKIMAARPDVRPITMLRNPVSRVLSDFRYQRSDMHPGHEGFRAAFPTLDSYVEQIGEANKSSLHVLPDGLRLAGDAAACVDYLMTTYRFIGFQEEFALSLHALTWFSKKPRASTVRRRVRDVDVADDFAISDAAMDRIAEVNRLDIAIHADLWGRFSAISAELAVYLDRVAPRI
jgi:hypothetical protein